MSTPKEIKTEESKSNEEQNSEVHVHGPNCNHHHHHEALKPVVRATPKVGRNDPCLCGSGKKFKKCCAN